jgi:hypothetical protein
LIEACENVQIVDFSLRRLDSEDGLNIATRLRFRDWGYLNIEADEDKQQVNLTIARWSLDLFSDESNEGLGAEYRSRYLRLQSAAQRTTFPDSDGWLTSGEMALRLGADFELIFGALEDRRVNPSMNDLERPLSSTSIGARWDRGSRFELSTRFTDATMETFFNDTATTEIYTLDGVFVAGALRLATGFEYQDVTGRFPREEGAVRLRADYRIGKHTVLNIGGLKKDDLDFGAIEEEIEVGVTLFARRHSYDRQSLAAASTVALHRHALEVGLNEQRGHTLEDRRRLRERLALSKQRAHLAGLIESLYLAQVADRNVPLAGFNWSQQEDTLDGSLTTTTELFWSIPWSAEKTLGLNEKAVEFLRFTFVTIQRDISSVFKVQGKRLGLDLSLNRELKIQFAWEDPIFSGLDFALDRNLSDHFEVALVYRYGI